MYRTIVNGTGYEAAVWELYIVCQSNYLESQDRKFKIVCGKKMKQKKVEESRKYADCSF